MAALCFAVSCERVRGLRGSRPVSWATAVRTRSLNLGQDIAVNAFLNLDPAILQRGRKEVRAVQVLATPYFVDTHSLGGHGPLLTESTDGTGRIAS